MLEPLKTYVTLDGWIGGAEGSIILIIANDNAPNNNSSKAAATPEKMYLKIFCFEGFLAAAQTGQLIRAFTRLPHWEQCHNLG